MRQMIFADIVVTEQFRYVSPLILMGAIFRVDGHALLLANAGYLSVEQARALHEWLGKALPFDPDTHQEDSRKVDLLRTALRDLLDVVTTDDLIPESVSYMKQAREAMEKTGGQWISCRCSTSKSVLSD
jgi:hypothetical protein